MTRLSEEERKALRKERDIKAKRAEAAALGYVIAEEAEVEFDHLAATRVGPAYTVTHDDDVLCGCGALMNLIATLDKGRTIHKSWRCPECRAICTGLYKPYVIQEEPGR